jgi:hypothetical protein
MNTLHPHSATLSTQALRQSIPHTRRHALLGLLASGISVMGLPACGGGGGTSAGVGSGGTGAFSVGVITGLGSIIVNGVRFDDSSARITDDDDNVLPANSLAIGMVVSVQSSSAIRSDANGNSATASSIVKAVELKGPVDSVNIAGNSFSVLGQTVEVNAATVYAPGLAGLSALVAGNLVEVYGFTDPATNKVLASRVERKSSLAEYRLSGRVSALDTATQTFAIGSLVVSYASANVRVTLVPGTAVRVRLQTNPSSGTRTAVRVQGLDAVSNLPRDIGEAEIEGTITAFTSLNSFSVNGVTLITNANTSFPDGTTGLVLGARVEVKGSISGGVFTATRVSREDRSEIEAVENELYGTISALNISAKTFGVRGITVDYSGNVEFRNGVVANLVNGRSVEVKGRINASSANLVATRIKFE